MRIQEGILGKYAMKDDNILFERDYGKANEGEIVTQFVDGGYIRKYYKKCPNCGGDIVFGSDYPEPGDETQTCCGLYENRGPDYDDAFAEDNGCGWTELMEHYPDACDPDGDDD